MSEVAWHLTEVAWRSEVNCHHWMSLITGNNDCTLSSGIIEAFICSGFMKCTSKCTSVTECCRHRHDGRSRCSIAQPSGSWRRSCQPGARGNRNRDMDRYCFGACLKCGPSADTDIPHRRTRRRADGPGLPSPAGGDRVDSLATDISSTSVSI